MKLLHDAVSADMGAVLDDGMLTNSRIGVKCSGALGRPHAHQRYAQRQYQHEGMVAIRREVEPLPNRAADW